MAAREVPEGLPRFGYMLDDGGRAVGAILVIAQTITHDGEPYVRCNLASWYVEPAYRGHAAMLSMMPFRSKGATFLNISAAPNTWATIEAQGFKRYGIGQRLSLPTLSRGDRSLKVRPFAPDDAASLPEAKTLADHAAVGCLALVGTTPEGLVPFLLMPVRMKQGRFWFPGMELVYCRVFDDVLRFAVPLGRELLRRGRPILVHDAPTGRRTLPGVLLPNRGRRYAKGPHTPRLGDLAYTEFTIFGP